MTDRHDPQLVDIIARAIHEELHGDNDSMDLLPAPLAAAAIARYQRAARAALAAMPQPAGYGILVHRYAPEAAWIIGPYDRTEADQVAAREPDLGLGTITVVALVPVQLPQDAAHATDTTQPEPECPPATTGPQNGTQGRNQWAAGYASARRFYGDSAPIALDKIRETIGLWTGTYGWAATSPVGDLIRDLRAILDTATEPHQ